MVVHTGDINIGNTVNAGNRAQVADRMQTAGDRARPSQNNLYNRPENRDRVADRATVARDVQQARAASGRDNNVYADPSGNVARRTGDQWETRDQGAWKSEPSVGDRPAPQAREPQAQPRDTRPAPAPSTPSVDRSSLDRSYQSRQSGAAQERMRPAPRPSGGGGRRR
jgi:hypothetical protein